MKLYQCESCVIVVWMLLLLSIGSVRAAGSVSEANDTPFLLPSRSLSDEPQNSSNTFEGTYGSAFYRVIAAVFMVVLLGIGAMYASKKLLPKWSAAQGKKIKVVETIHLGTRKTVHLLEVGNQQILIGTTADSMTKLADIYPDQRFPLGRPEHIEEAE